MAFPIPKQELTFLSEVVQKVPEKGKTNELEVRFGVFSDRGFQPDVGEATFKKLIQQLHVTKPFTALSPSVMLKVYTLTSDPDVYLLVTTQDGIKEYVSAPTVVHDNMSMHAKKKHHSMDNPDHNYRISLSSETDMPMDQAVLEVSPKYKKHFRYLKRYSFLTASGRFRMDMTLSKSSLKPAHTLAQSRVLQQTSKFEVEIEHIQARGDMKSVKDQDVQELYQLVVFVLRHMQEAYIPISQQQQKVVRAKYMAAFLPGAQSQSPERRHFLGVDSNSMSMVHLLPTDVNTHAPHVRASSPEDYVLTEKADGERHLLFISDDRQVFLLNNRMSVKLSGLRCSDIVKGPALIDGEYVNTDGFNTFLAFDFLFQDGEDLRQLPLHRTILEKDQPKGRLERLKALLLQDPFQQLHGDALQVKLKQFYGVDLLDPPGNISIPLLAKAQDLWEHRHDLFKYFIDGLIFTPRRAAYPKVEQAHSNFWKALLKWKPRELMSIDFLVRVQQNNGQDLLHYDIGHDQETGTDKYITYKVMHLYVGGKADERAPYQEMLFEVGNDTVEGSGVQTYIARRIVGDNGALLAKDPLSGDEEEFRDNMIVEFVYDLEAAAGFRWTPIRIRYDKTQAYKTGGLRAGGPNSMKTAASIWNGIHEMGGLASDASIFSLAEDPLQQKLLVTEYFKSKSEEKSYYSISETRDERRHRKTFDLVEFHNKIVKQLLYLGPAALIKKEKDLADVPRLLDLGCGKGGDYPRYKSAHIRKVYGIDKDKTGLDELQFKRHLQATQHHPGGFPKSVVTIQADMSRLLSSGAAVLNQQDKKTVKDYFQENGQFSFPLISCQFAMHYSMDKELSMRTFMINIFENLEMGGVFIATALDGRKVFDKLKKTDSLTFNDPDGHQFALIRKMYKARTFKAFGLAVDVTFESISQAARTEYLVDWDRFTDIMDKDFDIKVVSDDLAKEMDLPTGCANFDSIYNSSANHLKMSTELQEWSFLNKFVVMRKEGTGNAAAIKSWMAKIRAAETKQLV